MVTLAPDIHLAVPSEILPSVRLSAAWTKKRNSGGISFFRLGLAEDGTWPGRDCQELSKMGLIVILAVGLNISDDFGNTVDSRL